MPDAEWLFKTGGPSGPVMKTVVTKYIASVSTLVLASRFSMNPTLSTKEIRTAIEANEPPGLLPQPWPPADTSTRFGLEVTALTKMERVLSIVSGIRGSSFEELQSKIKETFPDVSLTTVPPGYKLFNFEVQLLDDGTVIHSYEESAQGDFPLRGCAPRPIEASLTSFLEAIVQADMLSSIERSSERIENGNTPK